MTEKTANTKREVVKSTVQTIAVSVITLALAWAPFLASANGGAVLTRSNYSSVSGAFGVFDVIEDIQLTQYRDQATGALYYVLDIDGEKITLNVQSSNVCESQLVAPAAAPGELSFTAKLTHRQFGSCAVRNPTTWELSINAFDPQGQRQGFALIQLQIRSAYRSGFGL